MLKTQNCNAQYHKLNSKLTNTVQGQGFVALRTFQYEMVLYLVDEEGTELSGRSPLIHCAFCHPIAIHKHHIQL